MKILNSIKELGVFTANLAKHLKAGDLILLKGNLGAGKTELVRQFILGISPDIKTVPSPTFTIVQEYETPLGSLYHYDLYRLEDPEEVFELGIEDHLVQGITFVEWPERLPRIYQPASYSRPVLTIQIDLLEDGSRSIQLTGTHRFEALIQEEKL